MDSFFNLTIFILLALIFFMSLYFVIKNAVRDAIQEILESKEDSENNLK